MLMFASCIHLRIKMHLDVCTIVFIMTVYLRLLVNDE